MATRLNMFASLTALLAVGSMLLACTPRDGITPFSTIDRREEIRIGEENFEPTLQARGGRYTLDPEVVSYVEEIGRRLANASGGKLPWEFAIVNNSLPNAWSLPGGKIAINRGLLVSLESEAQLAAVLAHEVAHATNSHAARAMERGLVIEATLRALGFGDSAADVVDSGALGIQIITARFSQAAEFEADADGMRYMAEAGFQLEGALTLQQSMLREQGSSQGGLTGSHPASRERIIANRRILEVLQSAYPVNSDDGRDRFLRKTRFMRNAEPAYVEYKVAIWELVRGNLEAAHERISAAMDIENREARFHALHAEYYERLGEIEAALEEYDTAIRLEPAYHALHQGKGLLLLRMGRLDEARGSLAIANAQLQDAETHEGLGDIAVAQGRLNDAIGHYTLASRSRGVAGERAREKLREVEAEALQAEARRSSDSRFQSPN
ncbi:MAG: M48 family metalloprotease [Gammaproteobacteria bacterium]|nr:M48 family metalloprotease [Gammaproteobacteria bacterium]